MQRMTGWTTLIRRELGHTGDRNVHHDISIRCKVLTVEWSLRVRIGLMDGEASLMERLSKAKPLSGTSLRCWKTEKPSGNANSKGAKKKKKKKREVTLSATVRFRCTHKCLPVKVFQRQFRMACLSCWQGRSESVNPRFPHTRKNGSSFPRMIVWKVQSVHLPHFTIVAYSHLS